MTVDRNHWLYHVKEIIRSRHYTWLPQGLGGESVEEAMTWLATDIMHVCKLAGVPVDRVLDRARLRCEKEEDDQFPTAAPTAELAHALPDPDGEELVTAYETNDVYDAEIVRGVLQNQGIASRVDSESQGGFTELVSTKVLVHARDSDRARKAIH